MIILVLDPAISTGYCLVRTTDNKDADIYEYGYIDADTSSDYQGDHCIDLMNKLQNIIDREGVEDIAVEGFFFSKKFANGCDVNVAYRTAIHILARQNNIPYTILSIPAWKTFVSGRKGPTKEQKKEWGPEPAKKLYIQDALWNNFWIRFPNHSISEKTGKPIMFRYDIVDVVAQTVYYCCMIKRIHVDNVTCSVEIPEDVVFTKKPKKMYVYNDD